MRLKTQFFELWYPYTFMIYIIGYDGSMTNIMNP